MNQAIWLFQKMSNFGKVFDGGAISINREWDFDKVQAPAISISNSRFTKNINRTELCSYSTLTAGAIYAGAPICPV